MRLCIHHGAAQIGGNCIELEAAGQSLLLDLGLPLQAAPVLPPVPGLLQPDPSFLGVVLSHPHLDHYGLLAQVRPDLPVWLGEGAVRLLAAAAPFAPGSALTQRPKTYRTGMPFEVGPFRLAPYLMDHSAFDAHALLIEADGRRVFYSGDFRGHGRSGAIFERFIGEAPVDVDVLLMEGTTISRSNEVVTEADVEAQAVQLMGEHRGLTLVNFAGQNIERFVSFFRAAKAAGREFVIDAYMANLILALRSPELPDVIRHPGIRVYLPRSQKRMIVRDQRFELVEPFRRRRVFAEELAATPRRFCMMFRASMVRDVAELDLAEAALIYSLWPGYLERDSLDLRVWAAEREVALHLVHSSGHAHFTELQRMAAAIAPKRLIPIHTERPEAFHGLYDRVEVAENGAWVEV